MPEKEMKRRHSRAKLKELRFLLQEKNKNPSPSRQTNRYSTLSILIFILLSLGVILVVSGI